MLQCPTVFVILILCCWSAVVSEEPSLPDLEWSTPSPRFRTGKTQRKARNSLSRGLWLPKAVSLWYKRAGVANL